MSKLTIRLKPKKEKRVLGGHLWVFSNEIAAVDGEPKPGDLGRLYSARGEFLAWGCYHPNSLIAFRVYNRADRAIDAEFLTERLRAADAYRQSLYPGSKSYRAVFGESDGLPGLVVDRYGDFLAIQVLSAGMEALRGPLTKALVEVFAAEGILAKNSPSARKLEGLPPEDEAWHGAVPDSVVIEENGLEYEVAIGAGQKTGWYYDQRENRKLAAAHAAGRVVLDGHSYLGGFALNCANAGATRVLGVETSPGAVELARRNAERNKLSEVCAFEKAPVEQFLGSLHELPRESRPDFILLDPPSLAKNKKSVGSALRQFVQLNAKALKGLRTGGLLASSTCSHHIKPEAFRQALADAAMNARRRVRVLAERGAAPDHPELLNMPETRYLNFALLEVV